MNLFNTDVLAKVPDGKIKRKTKAKHKMIAALLARGFSAKDVAHEVNLSESHISHLLSDKDSSVNAEITRILSELFADNDRHLINLYSKALQKLDNMFSSSDEEKQYRAMDRIIKIFFSRTAKNTIIQQYFSGQPQQKEFTFDDFTRYNEKRNKTMLQMRKERGLDQTLDDDKDDDDKELSDSPSDASAPDASSPNASAPDNSLADPSSPEYKKFLESVK